MLINNTLYFLHCIMITLNKYECSNCMNKNLSVKQWQMWTFLVKTTQFTIAMYFKGDTFYYRLKFIAVHLLSTNDWNNYELTEQQIDLFYSPMHLVLADVKVNCFRNLSYCHLIQENSTITMVMFHV